MLKLVTTRVTLQAAARGMWLQPPAHLAEGDQGRGAEDLLLVGAVRSMCSNEW